MPLLIAPVSAITFTSSYLLLSCQEANLYVGSLTLFNLTTFRSMYVVQGFSGRGGLFPASLRVIKATNNTLDLIVATVSRANQLEY